MAGESLSLHIPLGVPVWLVATPHVGIPLSIVGWVVVHVCVCALLPESMAPAKTMAWTNRITSLLHSVVAASLAVPFTLGMEAFPTPAGTPNTDLATLVLQISFGFFVMDLGMGTLSSVADLAVTLHHVVCMIGMGYALYTGVSGAELVTAIAIGELTIPPYCIRWMLRHARLTTILSRLYILNDLVFFASFLAFRMALGIPFTLYILSSPAESLLIKACAAVIAIISILWFITITIRTAASLRSLFLHGSWLPPRSPSSASPAPTSPTPTSSLTSSPSSPASTAHIKQS